MNKSKTMLVLVSGIMITVILSFIAIPLPSPLFPDDYSTVVLDRNREILRLFLNDREQWHLPPESKASVPKKLRNAVLLFEDRYFDYHPGINPFSMVRALYNNIIHGEITSGASTITMQSARLLEKKERSYSNKMLEILQAIKLEVLYSKEEIFKLYLNHAPYGGNIVGYQAAALRYFQKYPNELSWAEAAMLAVLPNAPGLISPDSRPHLLVDKRNRLLKNLAKESAIDNETLELALLEEIPKRSYALEMSAPHLAQNLKTENPNQSVLSTTIDMANQKMTQDICREHSQYISSFGINNLAAIVVETKTGMVSAYVGSPDFFNFKSRGQVDGVQAPRSSGSILKPFLYALAIDDGLILPNSQIRDIPTYFGPYSPANADMQYRGVTSAKTALCYSLNVPAVRLLNKFGLFTFYDFLKYAGVSTLYRPAEKYGLPLIIGGAETTLWDMAAAYRSLANGGKVSPIYVLSSDELEEETLKAFISEGAAYLTLDMLREVKRPGAEYYWQQYHNQLQISWKTGTSYGQRDAWAIGVNPQWTIAVWAGNFDGRGNANLTGSSIAGPLLFRIFNTLPREPELSWFDKPIQDLHEIELCATSGYKSTAACPETILADAPVNMKAMMLCPYHKTVYVSEDSKEQVCSICWEPGHYRTVSKLVYPPDVSQFLRQHGQVLDAIPAHRKSCSALHADNPVKIIYPQKNASLWIPRDFDGRLQKILFRAGHQSKDQRLYWYLDSHYVGSSRERHTITAELEKGWHILEVIDEIGNSEKVNFFANRKD